MNLRWISICASIRPYVGPPPKAQSSNPAHWGLNSSLLSLKSSLTENSPLRQKALLHTTEAWNQTSWAWNQALLSKQMDVWMDIWKFTPVFTEHGHFEATALLSPQDLGTAIKQGNGYCWPYEILGWLAVTVDQKKKSNTCPELNLWLWREQTCLTEVQHSTNRAIAPHVEFYIHSMPWTISFQKNQSF